VLNAPVLCTLALTPENVNSHRPCSSKEPLETENTSRNRSRKALTKEVGGNATLSQQGTFALRVSARTDIDFTVDTSKAPVQGEQGQVILQIINKGLGDIKSVSIEFFPNGFDLLSKSKIFIGTIAAEDSDTATYDVVYKSLNPI